jgi:phosphoribosylamine--glycine ligase
MKILLIGGNAGTDFLAQKFLEYPEVETVYLWGANGEQMPTNRFMPLNFTTRQLYNFPKNLLSILDIISIDLIVTVPVIFTQWVELQEKIKLKNIPAVMVSQIIGKLEWSKIAGKKFLQELKIPTPQSRSMSREDLILEYFDIPRPFVIKYEQDWRAGKQTVIVDDDNYEEEFENLVSVESTQRVMKNFVGNFKDQRFVVEEFVEGVREYSYHAISNAVNWQYIGTARDYKKRDEGDKGHNTVGMGCYSPVEIDARVHEYADKIFSYLKTLNEPYRGVLYLGIMVKKDGTPVVLEINSRFGDPEMHAILLRIKNNLLKLFVDVATDKEIEPIEFLDQSAVSVRVVNKNYDCFDTKKFIPCDLWPTPTNIYVSVNQNRKLLNSVVSTTSDTVEQASDVLYQYLKNKEMNDFTYRTDIGYFK